MSHAVALSSIWLSWISFALFVGGSIINYRIQLKTADAAQSASRAANGAVQRVAPGGSPANAPPPGAPTIGELSDLFKAITGAIDVVVKAGPSLAGLVASILFLGIGCWASTDPEPRACTITKETVISIKDNKLQDPISVNCKSTSAQK